ncbi:MAG TPA: GTPase [Hyphomicrobiaceae bacterium]|nr:GTPase [Hyphomicrobiaceae bacterium]
MSERKRPRVSPLVLLAVALVLPAASLIPLGSLWLWERGYLLYWAVASSLLVAAIYALQRRLLVPLPTEPSPAKVSEASEPADSAWTSRQAQAWEDVIALASKVKAERMMSRDAAVALGLETVETVAKRIHPDRSDPLLQFTVPEALAVIERASANLRGFLVSSFPLGDRITVAQFMWLYRWRSAVRLAERGYDLWRVVRLLNPVAAATQEMRERLSRQLYEMGRDHLAERLARAYVKEVGRAAIDLYGGNLRVTREAVRSHVTAASRRDLAATHPVGQEDAEPIRILLAGQTGVGKSSLVNALADAVEAAVDVLPTTVSFTPYRFTHDGLPAALIIDSPGVAGAEVPKALIEAADDSDMVLWVCSASRAAREMDARALAAIRNHFEGQPNRRRPPMLLVLTHIDALRPFHEWNPPYDLNDAACAKARSIRDAMDAAASDLGFDDSEIVPVRSDIAPYNVDALWAKIIELMPEAQRVRLLRTLRDIASVPAWRAIWSQAAGAGRTLKGVLFGRNRGG